VPSPEELLERIKQSAHWRVTIRPSTFERLRVPDLPDCWRIIESSAVALRGWDYPHVDRLDRANGTDWIESWCEFRGHQEYWRFYQSGQFVHLLSLREDAIPNSLERAIEKVMTEIPPEKTPSGCLDVVEVLFTLTEIYEFCSRLAQKMALQGSVIVTVELVNVKSRILTALEFSRAWWGYYPSAVERLPYSNIIPVERLIADSAQLALDAAIWFFHRFQWNDPNRTVLQNDQRNLLTRNLR
jgi:hypothetical protein